MADSVKRFSGTGEPGYVDGEPGSVQFSHPRSFAIDLKGNVYVADRENNVIRKITDTGSTFSFLFLINYVLGIMVLTRKRVNEAC